jgi:hypothetical protein
VEGLLLVRVGDEGVEGKSLSEVSDAFQRHPQRPLPVVFRDPDAFFAALNSTARALASETSLPRSSSSSSSPNVRWGTPPGPVRAGAGARVFTTTVKPASLGAGTREEVLRVEILSEASAPTRTTRAGQGTSDSRPEPSAPPRLALPGDVLEVVYSTRSAGADQRLLDGVPDVSSTKTALVAQGDTNLSSMLVLGAIPDKTTALPAGLALALRGMRVGEVRKATIPPCLLGTRARQTQFLLDKGLSPGEGVVFECALVSIDGETE